MNIEEYYSLLGLKLGASISDIKKAYRAKALLYHPDRNQSQGAAEMFVRVSEAYQYLVNNQFRTRVTEAEREKAYAAWVDYRRKQAKEQAENYARASYAEFRKSDLFKSTQSIDGNILVFGFVLSIMIICYSIYGYSYRVANATSEKEMPSLPLMLLSIVVGIIFLMITMLYFLAWRKDRKKEKTGKQQIS